MDNDPRQWYHIIITVYGGWLYGDARSFRTRHHREHIIGDYKSPPPPGLYKEKARRSRRLMKQGAVIIEKRWRSLIGMALWQEFTRRGNWILAIAVSGQHVHLLVKLRKAKRRGDTGRAKRFATLKVRRRGWKGKLWGVRDKNLRIRNRMHQVHAFRYIVAHADEGAWIGVWRVEGGPRTEN